jgi:hypothetical protein
MKPAAPVTTNLTYLWGDTAAAITTAVTATEHYLGIVMLLELFL